MITHRMQARMKHISILAAGVLLMALASCGNRGKVVDLDEAGFREKIYEFDHGRVGPFKGSRPAIVDFYADWCKPCLAMAPVFDEIATTYAGRIDVYRVDVRKEDQFALDLGVRQLPTLFFIPEKGHTKIIVSAMDSPALFEMAEALVKEP